MNVIDKQRYVAPQVELISIDKPLRLLASVSLEADFEDWDEGEAL